MSPNFPHKQTNIFAAVAILVGLFIFPAAGRAKTEPDADKKDAQSRFAKFDGMRVHYQNSGKGDEALVFVHGWTCDLSFWRMQSAAFTGKTRVIAVDLPGHGRSDKPQIAYTMDLFARSVEAVLRDAGVKRAVLVGHSMGMPVVRQFYRKYPEKTLALVDVDGALRPFAARAAMERFIAPLRGDKYRETAAGMVEGMVRPVQSAALREEIKTAMLSTPQHVAVSAMEGMADDAIWAEDQIRVPVLAVLARSPFWPTDTEAHFRKVAPALEYEMWDGVSHFLMMDKPEDFNRTLARFLVARKLLGQK
ncbi:MAG TPA: alpha/beta hydrolase [Pyrinomonadaceae bacterium]|nr:alpha/beta hydrolase [Pyrinomonadaceae bacterium]